ncbi:retinol dehydrogenase 12 [Periconia macrospinosa]|uniref:Retinol dehydrogenase 12 n=1 Tax=Periconia macrospinosa TaxID=97972 RepID=A0A2V1DNY9_9PLEO|nr:retinol dehydrogenase 12 [Periconia macrospinosa]
MGFLYSQLFKTPSYPDGNFNGKTVIITGSNIGLGKEAGRHFARLGAAKLILAVRNIDKGQAATDDVLRTTGHKNTHVWNLDMSDYKSIQSFAKRAETELERVDIFIANAGVLRAEYNEVNGHEEGIAVNIIGTTLLMANMMPKMRETAARFNTRPTFTITGSVSYEYATFPQRSAPDGAILAVLSDRRTCEKYWSQQYSICKLAQLFIVRSVAERYSESELPVTINIVNPGLCRSELRREIQSWGSWLLELIFARSTQVGSRTLVHAGASGVETHGKYLSDCMIEEPKAMVTDAAGQENQARLSYEVFKAIEDIQPGVLQNFKGV